MSTYCSLVHVLDKSILRKSKMCICHILNVINLKKIWVSLITILFLNMVQNVAEAQSLSNEIADIYSKKYMTQLHIDNKTTEDMRLMGMSPNIADDLTKKIELCLKTYVYKKFYKQDEINAFEQIVKFIELDDDDAIKRYIESKYAKTDRERIYNAVLFMNIYTLQCVRN